jgi:hypothetical protein
MSNKTCNCTNGACSRCYTGPVTDLPLLSDEERYKAHVAMEKEAHAEAVTQANAPAV